MYNLYLKEDEKSITIVVTTKQLAGAYRLNDRLEFDEAVRLAREYKNTYEQVVDDSTSVEIKIK